MTFVTGIGDRFRIDFKGWLVELLYSSRCISIPQPLSIWKIYVTIGFGKQEDVMNELDNADSKLISRLLAEKMRAGGLSTRDVAGETGVAHTTIMRVLQGRVVSVKTLKNVARFLEADPGLFLTSPGDDPDEALAKDLAAIIGREPRLREVLSNAVAQTKAGNLSAETLREIVRYAAWRIEDTAGRQTSQLQE